MKLRKLEIKDAEKMHEWMHDESVVEHLKADFSQKTISDCIDFIKQSKAKHDSHNYAIVDDNDEYMGTVSLKNINKGRAEFAIVVRSVAMGKGYAVWAINEILRIGFVDLRLKIIYWCVSLDNKRANRFYKKLNFCEFSFDNQNDLKKDLIKNNIYTVDEIDNYKWYFAGNNL